MTLSYKETKMAEAIVTGRSLEKRYRDTMIMVTAHHLGFPKRRLRKLVKTSTRDLRNKIGGQDERF